MNKDEKDLIALGDLAGITLKEPLSKKDEEVLTEQGPGTIELVPANRLRQGVITSLGATPESTKLKKKMLLGKKKESKEKLPEHIRKVYIVINDKSKNEPISVKFAGDWTVSDLNLAGKHLILEYNTYSRDRAIRSK